MVNVRCPKCDARMPYVAELAGREIFCLGCGSHFVIPILNLTISESDPTPAIKPIPVDIPYPIQPTVAPEKGRQTSKN